MSANSVLMRGLPVFTLLLYVAAVTLGAFDAGTWGCVGIGGAALLFLAVWSVDKKIPWPQQEVAVFTLFVLAVLAALNFTSSQPDISWRTWEKLASIFLPLILLSNPKIQARVFRPDFFGIVFIASLVGAVALGGELLAGGPLLQAIKGSSIVALAAYNRSISYIVLLSLPLMAGLLYGPLPFSRNKRWLLLAVFILALLFPASLTESRSAKLALMLALPTVGAAYLWPVLTQRVLMIASALFVSWPFAAQKFFLNHYDSLSHFPPSWHARMEIWDYMSYRILERPILGWGLGTAHTLPFQEPHGAQYIFVTGPVGHPHNVITELWVELGIPGLVLGLMFAFLMLRKAGKLDAKIAPFAMGAWVAALCLSLVAYDFWTDSLWAAFALTGFAFAMLDKNKVAG